ncbi:MAG: hypothetical protein KDA44_19465 [Planctomycetales bacterium]|nr:hypothetical protein [Planctomycetales bacterium]
MPTHCSATSPVINAPYWAAWALLAAVGLGCADSAREEVIATPAGVAAVPTTTSAPADAPADDASSPEGQPPADGDAGDELVKQEQEYVAPFPDRVELFVAPKRAGKSERKQGVFNEAVELLGFVTVDKPRAVLSIDGQVAPVAQGDMKFGIEVISIEPPKVVLQRGRQRWQASLEN